MTGEKMRVYEIAKEVGIPNKDLIAKIRALGLEVNNHMSSLDADDVARIKRSLEKEKAGADKPAQTQRLGAGAVLRRRSSVDKTDGRTKTEEAVVRPAVPATSTGPAPVIRRRPAAASTATPAAESAQPTPAPPKAGEAPTASASPAVLKRTPAAAEPPAAPAEPSGAAPSTPAPAPAPAEERREQPAAAPAP